MNKSIANFFLLTFLISWTIWGLSTLYFPSDIFILLGAWSPTFSALLCYRIFDKQPSIKPLLKKVTIWRTPFRMYMMAFFGVLGIGILSVLLNYAITGNHPSASTIVSGLGLEPSDGLLILLLAPVLFLINTIIGGPTAEELGWRGYAQPILTEKLGVEKAGLVIGFLWAIWHLPLFYIKPEAVAGIPLTYYIPLLSAAGVLFSWLHSKTNGSVLMAIIFHGSFNFTVGVLGMDALKDISLLAVFVALIAIVAVVIAFREKNEGTGKG